MIRKLAILAAAAAAFAVAAPAAQAAPVPFGCTVDFYQPQAVAYMFVVSDVIVHKCYGGVAAITHHSAVVIYRTNSTGSSTYGISGSFLGFTGAPPAWIETFGECYYGNNYYQTAATIEILTWDGYNASMPTTRGTPRQLWCGFSGNRAEDDRLCGFECFGQGRLSSTGWTYPPTGTKTSRIVSGTAYR